MNAETLKVIITAEADKMKAELEKAKGYIESFEGKSKQSLEKVDSHLNKATDPGKVKTNMDKAAASVKQFSDKGKASIKKVGDSLDKISGGKVKAAMAKAEGAVDGFSSKARASIKKVDDAFSKLGGGKVKAAMSKAKGAIDGFASKAKGGISNVAGSFSAIAAKGAVAFAAVAAAAVAAFGKITSSLMQMEEQTREYRRELARLETSFQGVGGTADDAKEAFRLLYRTTGDIGMASEAAGHLSRLSTDMEDLSEKAMILQGVYASFPNDAIEFGGFPDAIADTISLGTVTGTLADALNWVGVNEDAFNEKLAECNGTAERSQLIWSTLHDLYYNAGLQYEKNAAGVLAVNNAEMRLMETKARLSEKIAPVKAAFSNLAATLLNFLAPAITFVGNLLASLANVASRALNAVAQFINKIAGRQIIPTMDTISEKFGKLFKGASQFKSGLNGASKAMSKVGNGVDKAVKGAKNLAKGIKNATKEANKLNRTTQAFDELIKAKAKETSSSTPNTGGSSGGSGSGSSGGTIPDLGDGNYDINVGVNGADEAEGIIAKLGKKIREIYDEYIKPFVDDIKAIGKMIYDAAEPYIQPIIDSFKRMASGIGNVLGGIVKIVQGAFRIITGFLTGDTDKVYDGFDKIKEGFGQIGDGAVDAVGGLADLVKNVSDMGDSIGSSILGNIGKVFSDLWQDAWDNFENSKFGQFLIGAKDKFIELKANVTELPGSMREKVAEAWDKIKDKSAELKASFADVTSSVRERLSNAWDKIKDKTSTLKGKFTDAYYNVRNRLLNAWSKLKSKTATLKGKFRDVTSGTRKRLISAWNKLKTKSATLTARFRDFFSGALRSAWNGIARGINSGISIINRIPGVNIGRVPYLAQGGITKGSTLAHIGEGGYKEAVLPLERNTGWMNTLADKIAERGGGGARTIVLELDGRELGRACINSINDITQQTGKLQLTFA